MFVGLGCTYLDMLVERHGVKVASFPIWIVLQISPTDLQHLCCKVLINKLMSIWFHMGYFEIK